ncbi:MAG: YaiI/YqxD family protein [Rhodospirillaceae bacterium]
MHIWVDADACPGVIKDILYRAAERERVALVLVANRPLRVPASPWIRTLQVPAGFDVADEKIAAEIESGDLVITADIPLASQAIARGAQALDPRGTLYTRNNIEEALTLRNFMSDLRGSGVQTRGPAPHSHADRQAFANQLDRWLTARLRK